ncbi:type III-B CRISPR module RAMP protein Cmr6 [Thermoflavimicrobium dichotomicum]|uniref:CRISPR-associated protein Cmr6 n=1 Tax=Thermoflavimicrobium dichotomicum TaxID=46223 RepID=A0A1I3T5R0_9BACL|nr:type III-B CRISPR module RAMP protein Cmr6 [Thermoflavimicrobium dichotomicum]SFJ66315.1 CRISPR-associated protein Cmr6 [Thermoflavimicrobium dichotomicum]
MSTNSFLPLYNQRNHSLRTCPEQANIGLWYDKFCDTWELVYKQGDWEKTWNKQKAYWTDKVAGKIVGDQQQLDELVRERYLSLVKQYRGNMLFMRTISRFVTGIGRPHPVENGMSWHHTLSVPYLAGSSVKGMVRAWTEQWMEEQVSKKELDRIFGPDDPDLREVGHILFLDAVPVQPVKLEKEIITVHYQDYYRRPYLYTPVDSGNPKPNPFLCVAAGVTFVFPILPRSAYAGYKEDVKKVSNWLKQALEWSGAGAKTSSGYGRFTEDHRFDELRSVLG